jgi:hypothetical protein
MRRHGSVANVTQWLAAAVTWALASFSPQDAHAREWPKLEGGEAIAECTQALELARSVFESKSFYLYERPATPNNFASMIVLSRKGLGVSSGDALEADPATFMKFRRRAFGLDGQTYWQRLPDANTRLVVREVPHSWRGSNFDIFLVRNGMTPEAFATALRSGALPSISGSKWHPPLVLRNVQSGVLWLIDMNGEFLGDWPILTMDRHTAAPTCTVRFRPPADAGVELLPQPVQALASMIAATFGDGSDEGTLQTTARRRNFLSHLWANAALRPWALSDSAYNTRAEVDQGLAQWSEQTVTHGAWRESLLAKYELAEDSLAAYYEREFRLSATQAREMAAFALDVGYRSSYIFRVGYRASQQRRPNPWPAGF